MFYIAVSNHSFTPPATLKPHHVHHLCHAHHFCQCIVTLVHPSPSASHFPRHLSPPRIKSLPPPFFFCTHPLPHYPLTLNSSSIPQSYKFDKRELGKVDNYTDVDGIDFKRSISSAGVSTYRLNDREVSQKTYEEVLGKIDIIVKARNSLVFQGDVESIAQRSPQSLMLFFEQISGSDQFKKEYNELKAASQTAEKSAIDVHNRRRLIQKEVKLAQRDKHEAKKFDDKRKAYAAAKLQKFLWQIFHNKEMREAQTEVIEVAKAEVLEATQEVSEIETLLSSVKQAYHTLRLEETKAEKGLAHAQEALDKLQPASIELREKVTRGEQQIERAKAEVRLAERNVERHRIELEEAKQGIDVLVERRSVMVQSSSQSSDVQDGGDIGADGAGNAEEENEERAELAASLVGEGAHAREYEEVDQRYRQDTADTNHRLETTSRQRERCRERLERLERELSDVSGARSERLEKAIDTDARTLQRLRQAVDVANRSIDTKQTSLSTMKQQKMNATRRVNELLAGANYFFYIFFLIFMDLRCSLLICVDLC